MSNPEYIPTKSSTLYPQWSDRNRFISNIISEYSSMPTVLDLGCGSKDLLRYLKTPYYLGVDFNAPPADVYINLNNDFNLPNGEWDFIVCSGVIEYLNNIDAFFKKIKNNSSMYIFTFFVKFRKINKAVGSIDDFEHIINENFNLQYKIKYKSHFYYVCRDSEC